MKALERRMNWLPVLRLCVKAHGNVDIIEYGAEGQNVKAFDN